MQHNCHRFCNKSVADRCRYGFDCVHRTNRCTTRVICEIHEQVNCLDDRCRLSDQKSAKDDHNYLNTEFVVWNERNHSYRPTF